MNKSNRTNLLILTLLFLSTTLLSVQAQAVQQSELSLSESCRNTVEKAVHKKLGQDDETFSIVSSTLLYGGSVGGLHFSPVVLVKTSDEVEPRDVIVITMWHRNVHTNEVGCKVTHIETVADGLTVDFE